MVTYIEQGNIFKLEGVNNYAHGCNCIGAMGKGIAVQFKIKFPLMYKEYKSLCVSGGFNLGDVFAYNYGNGYVFNLGTQTSWRTKAEIKAIEKSLKNMLFFASEQDIKEIALPKIGAGLGGLQWFEVKNIIDIVSKEYSDIELFVVENYQEE
ncbi:MAG: macro domain-containing protein [Saprospiraceae bacterium]|nr:macro domain-containing protein [Saprospiraceae bacterium]